MTKQVRDICKDEELLKSITDTKVDYYLWAFRREKAKEMEAFPYHRTRSIYY